MDTDEERRVCLENVLSINPGNEPARRGLARLKADRPLRSLDSVKAPTPRADDESPVRADMLPLEPAAAKQAAVASQPAFQKPEIKRAKRKSQLTSTQWLILFGAGAIVLLVFCCLIGLLWPSPPQSVTSDSSPSAPTATPTPLPPLPRTVTTGEWAFTVTGVDFLNVIETPSKRYRPEKGIYLVILGTVANASDENETFRFSDWKLQDADGIRYEVDGDATEAAKSIYVLDYPGWILGLRVEYDHSRETYVLFDIPSDSKELQLYFKGGTTPLVLGDAAYLTQLAETTGKATAVASQAATTTTIAPTPEPSIPEATRKQVFYDLVAAQDSGVGDEKAYEVVAQQYGITVDKVKKIAIEGVESNWPMPLVPTDTPSAISPGEFDDEMIAAMIELVCSPYGVTQVEIADGRSAGGERIAIATLETDTTDLNKVFSGLGAVFGAAYEASAGEVQGDLDSVLIIIGNMDGMATVTIGANMSDIEAWKAGKITDEQFFNTWIIVDL